MHQVLGIQPRARWQISLSSRSPRGTYTKSQCLSEVDKGFKVKVRGLRVRGDKGRFEKAVREGLTEELTFLQDPERGNSLEAGVAKGQ